MECVERVSVCLIDSVSFYSVRYWVAAVELFECGICNFCETA